ncbi:MAG: hypothetical protein ABFE16_11325 [Armatimonadia bacterium]
MRVCPFRPGLLLVPLLAWAQPTDTEARQQQMREYVAAERVWAEDGLTASISDCHTDVPFLDDYRPSEYLPLAEMPRARARGFLLVSPGVYEMDAAGFCLHAGAYRPSRGDGYAPGPLVGRASGPVHEVLWNWAEHPEIKQREVQCLLWALVGRMEVDRLKPEIQRTARALLSEKGLAAARTQQRGPRPEQPELISPELQAELEAAGAQMNTDTAQPRQEMEAASKAFEELTARLEGGEQVDQKELAAALERVLKAQQAVLQPTAQAVTRIQAAAAKLEEALSALSAPYSELERVAVPEGNPDPPAGSRKIPTGRWSYQAGGVFVRYLPEDYTRVRVEVSLPPAFTVRRDALGRICDLTSEAGSAVSFAWAEPAVPLAVPGDDAVRGYALTSLQVTKSGTKGAPTAVSGWAFVGVPSGKGAPQDAGAFTGVEAKYRAALQHRAEVLDLVKALSKPTAGAGEAQTQVSLESLADALDLGSLAEALRPMAKSSKGSAGALRVVQEAWQAALCERVADLPGAQASPTSGPSPQTSNRPCSPGPAGPQVTLEPRVRFAAFSGMGGLGLTLTQRQIGPGLPTFDPGASVVTPGNSARQRLGIGPVQSPVAEPKEMLQKAVDSCDFLKGLLDVFNGLTDPLGFLMEKLGLGAGGLPGMMLDGMLGWIFDAAAGIAQALGGDPPRADFREFTLPPPPVLPQYVAGEGLSEDRARAGNDAASAFLRMYESLRAAQIAGDRLGGALEACDEDWARRQARAFVYHKRVAGLRMVTAADRYSALLKVMEQEGAEDRRLTEAEVASWQARLRTEGFNEASLKAARQLGLSEEEIEAARLRRLAVTWEDLPDEGLLSTGSAVATSLRAVGRHWSRLPELPAPEME